MPPYNSDDYPEMFEEELKHQVENSRKLMALRTERVNEFKEEFGGNLATISLAYARRRVQSEVLLVEGIYHPTNEVRNLYAKGIIDGLSQQPEEKREEWLSTFFEKLDKLEPPQTR